MLRAGLSDQQRDIIELKRLGYTNEEIAERTGWHIRKVQRFFKDLHESWQTSGGSQ
jgi:DNA-binding CsgD family transcriptional regulator